VASVSSLEEIINDIDAVYIATPPSSHSALTIQALEAGKHVFLEKPLAITLDDCDKIVNAAEDAYKTNRLIVNINIGMRFNAALHEMKKKVHQDSFGTIESISLRLLFRQWPRAWQNQPWVARRAEVSCQDMLD
jgi:predicted dehydrogenase